MAWIRDGGGVRMRRTDQQRSGIFSYISAERRVLKYHPVSVRTLARELLPEGISTKLRRARSRYQYTKSYKSRYVSHTYGGFPLKILLTDSMAQDWYDRDLPELNELALLKQHGLRSGAKVFDIGAHQGVFALMMAKIVGPRGMVVGVEANWHNAAIARENRDLNSAPQLVIVEAAAAEKSGTLFVSEELNGHIVLEGGKSGRWPVPCLSIDELTLQYGVPNVLFIDVEGFEMKVLEGATQTLKHQPDCFVEVHVGCGLETYGFSAKSVVSFFRTRGYRLFIAEQDEELFSRAFHGLKLGSPLPDERFFLVALNGQGDDESPPSETLTD
jgi:FkbM family methyltransferase